MDSLKQLIDMVANLPNAALWVLGGYLLYQLSILASVYGTIRYLAKTALEAYKHQRVVTKEWTIGGGVCVNETAQAAIIGELRRLAKHSTYVHASDAARLSRALDLLLDEEKARASTWTPSTTGKTTG